MAFCDIDALLADANTNRFTSVAQSPTMTNAVALQLLYETTGSTATIEELLASACENKFNCVAQDSGVFYPLANQLLCNSV